MMRDNQDDSRRFAMTMRTINPATEEVIETFDARTPAQTDEIEGVSELKKER
jgi:hypothetical protein